MITGNYTAEAIEAAKAALALANPQDLMEQLQKAGAGQGWTQSATSTSGITYYDLEAPSKHLVPFLSPIRNSLPRVSGGLGIQANWRAITGLNTANLTVGVSEGNRGGISTSATTDYFAKFVTLGIEDSVTDEAQRAAKNFEDLRASAQLNLLNQFMVEEERVILGGQGTFALTTQTPTPTGVMSTGGGMTQQATVAYCVALSLEGLRQSGAGSGVTLASGTNIAVPITFSRTRAGVWGGSDTINLGQCKISAESSAYTLASSNKTITWSVTSVAGAVAYAWFTGTTGAGNCALAAITTTNVFVQTADAAGSQLANATGLSTDHSSDSTVFDGIIAQFAKSGSGAYVKSLDNANFASTAGDGTVDQIETALGTMYDNKRLGPKVIYFNRIDAQNYKKNVYAKSGTPSWQIRVPSGPGGQIEMVGGSIIPKYFNQYTNEEIDVQVHPYLPQGTAIGWTQTLPYKLNDVPNVFQMKMRLDYYSEEWPRTKRAYEFGVYEDGVLQCYFPGAGFLLQNIGNG